MELSELIQEMFHQCQFLDLLYVEDDKEIATNTTDMLKGFFHSVTVVYDGEEGLKAFKEGTFDIVLTDIMMPKIDGRVMSRQIKEIKPDQAIIVMSAFEEIEYFRDFIDIGISKFIAKPPVFQYLMESFISTAMNINNAKKIVIMTQELQRDLDEKKELLHRIIDTVPVRIFWKNKDSRYLGCNALYALDAGLHNSAEIIGKSDYELIWKEEAANCVLDDQHVMSSEEGKYSYEEKFVNIDGKNKWLSMSKVPLKGDTEEIIGVLGSYIDITEQKETIKTIQLAKDALGYQAQHDSLTGLPNRLLYMDRLEHAIQKAKRAEEKIAVVFIDLDRFKQINDSLGHEIGDKVVQILGARLSTLLREEDTIARFGGDEFTILIESITSISDISDVMNKIIESMEVGFEVNGHNLHLTLSAGISFYPDDGDTAELLLRNADTAMYRAKEEGRNASQFYTKEMTDKTVYSMTMVKNIRLALENKEFEVYYQPQIDANTNQLIGMEALIRWNSPSNGFISPGLFIPIAEDAGIIDKIGEFVFAQATSQIVHWYSKGYNPGRVAINLSTIELQKEDFVESIERRLKEFKCQSDWIELEITEGYTMKHPQDSIKMLQRLKDLGIQLSIDDFGTGYSSLSYLHQLPVHKLKIDQSFVRDIPGNAHAEAIVKSVIFLAKTMKFDIIAEGVETIEQQNYLVSKGCKSIQGYYHAKPMPASQMEEFIKSHT